MTHKWWVKNKGVFTTLFLLFLFQKLCPVSADISGVVINEDGLPIKANIEVLKDKVEIESLTTGSSGEFALDIPSGQYTLIIYSDDFSTPGFDYVPAAINIEGAYDGRITLIQGSTQSFVGDIQFVDTENIPLQTIYSVQDNSSNVIAPNGFPLQFGVGGNNYKIPELSSNEIILPANKTIDINVSCTILIGTQLTKRSFLINDIKAAKNGEINYIDIRKYSIPISQSLTSDLLVELDSRFTKMNQYGFYLAKQETALGKGITHFEESRLFYDVGDFEQSFGSMKRGYLLFAHTNSELLNIYNDARLSVYLLITFLTIASLVTGYLLVEEIVQQLLVDLVLLGLSLVYFYYTYPGSQTIRVTNFAFSSLGIYLIFIGIGNILPRLLARRSIDGRVHTRNLISPIFNIAKRSLRRRKIRFILTFISISLLVMSFVTLTSFSEGYGLITGESSPKTGWLGVYIRDRSWKRTEPSFIRFDEVELNWILSQSETKLISIKAESIPLRFPLTEVKEYPIYGIIGISENENYFINLNNSLIKGRLPVGNGIIISESLSQNTGFKIGDFLYIETREYKVTGILRDDLFNNIKDLDGTSYTSNKWINISPEGEAPTWVLEDVEPNELLIMNFEQAIRFPTVGIQRVAIKVKLGFNHTGFAERLALERGYLAWANTDDSYTSYKLGNYFQGKGVTLFIPWTIVVLNVIVTMLNNLYERKNEIEILSSVGLNPAQVSSIFIAEAFITGFIAGGLGYLLGLGLYKALAFFNIGLQVNQKVSAVWSFAAIGLAISAVITGAFTALQNSVVITPSLMRRWKLDRNIGGFQEPWRIEIPIKMESAEVKNYLDYVESALRELENHHIQITSSIKRKPNSLEFVYKSIQTTTGNFYTRNNLLVVPLESGEFGAILESLGETERVHTVGSLIRRLTMDYSSRDF
jgi:ABC-type antimicrobial peptide transport system permease subunit